MALAAAVPRCGTCALIEAAAAALDAPVRGKAVPPGETAEYPVTVSNCTDQPQAIVVSPVRHGWEAMQASVEPSEFSIAPGGTAACTVHVNVPQKIPPGGHEEQVFMATANGDAALAATLSLTTTAELPHPYILHTPARWQEVRDKVKNYPWAKQSQDEYVHQAEKWNVAGNRPAPRQ